MSHDGQIHEKKTKEEIRKVVKEMKNGKAAGIDSITVEKLKA